MAVEEERSFPHIRALIVEDRSEMRSIIRSILNHIGVRRVEVAANGEEALQKLQSSTDSLSGDAEPFNFIISDWMMPRMDGMTLLHTLRTDPAFRDIPFLMITSQDDRPSVLAAATLGVTDYVVKPFPARVLEQKVLGIVERIAGSKSSRA